MGDALMLSCAPRTPQVLTLANGDRILMTPAMKAFFEPENLANASPATVSRAGIIYVSDTELGWEPVAKSWLQKKDPNHAAALQPCFDRFVNKMLDFVRLNLKPVMYNEQVSQVGTLMTLLDGCIKTYTEKVGALDATKLERLFIYCAAWALGGLLSEKDRVAFDGEMRSLGSKQMPAKHDDTDTVFEYKVSDVNCEWQHWVDCVPVWVYPKKEEKPKFAQLVIPTLDSVRAWAWFGVLILCSLCMLRRPRWITCMTAAVWLWFSFLIISAF